MKFPRIEKRHPVDVVTQCCEWNIVLDPRAEADFGYRPEYDLDRGLREYIEFLKSGRYAAVA